MSYTDSISGSVKESYEYTYDKNGNRLTQNKDGEVTTYTYNGLDQLVSYTSTKDGQVQVSQTNEYNGDGRRISDISKN